MVLRYDSIPSCLGLGQVFYLSGRFIRLGPFYSESMGHAPTGLFFLKGPVQ